MHPSRFEAIKVRPIRWQMWPNSLQPLAAAILAHPGYEAASRRLFSEMVSWRVRLGVLNKVFSNLGRERIFEHLLFLHYVQDVDRFKNGATFERLAELSEARDGFGGRAVRTALRLSLIAGLVTLARSREDGRLKIFEPTETLLDLTRDYYAILLGLFDLLLPGETLSRSLREGPDVLPALFERVGRVYLADGRPPSPSAEPFVALLRLEAGQPILATVVDCWWRGCEVPPTQELAQRFYVSVSQARVILKAAQHQGLIEIGPRGRLLKASFLAEQYCLFYARHQAYLARHGLQVEEGWIVAAATKL